MTTPGDEYLKDLMAQQFLMDSLDKAVNGGVNFTNISLIFPPEVRKEASEALARCGYKESAKIVESLTGTPSYKGIC